jgi:hypothetical protein
MTPAEQVAFTMLSGGDGTEIAAGTLRSSWAAQALGAQEHSEEIAAQLDRLGERFLSEADAAIWVARAAHLAGTPLAATAASERGLRERMQSEPPGTVQQWSDLLLELLAELRVPLLRSVVRRRWFESTLIAGLFSDDSAERPAGWRALQEGLRRWLAGDSLREIASAVHGREVVGALGRAATDPIPRTLRVVHNGFAFDLATAAGMLAALVDTAAQQPGATAWVEPDTLSAQALARLPLAMRFGSGSGSVLALIRAGARPRVVAHLIDRIAAPAESSDDETLERWASQVLRNVDQLLEVDGLSAGEIQLLASFVLSREP